jgi:opacity protein-like surface antigen
MKKQFLIFLLTSLLFCHLAQAKIANNPWYIGYFGEVNISSSGTTNNPSIQLVSEPIYRAGYNQGLSLGYKINPIFHLALELSYLKMSMDRINNAIPGQITFLQNSSTKITPLMLNGYLNLKPIKNWTPFIGLGLGYVSFRNTIRPNPPIVAPFGVFTEKTLNFNDFGYQGIIGFRYPITQRLHVDFHYKYFATSNASNKGSTNLGPETNISQQKMKIQFFGFNFSYSLDSSLIISHCEEADRPTWQSQ